MTAIRSTIVAVGMATLVAGGCAERKLPAVDIPVAKSSRLYIGDLSCEGRARCITVYLTPWCPACKNSIPFIGELRDYVREHPVYGLNVVVGADNAASLETMAGQIGGLVYIDSEAQFGRASGIHAYPTWLVSDRDGIIVRKYARGAPHGGTVDERIRFFLEKELRIE